ncbi:MAG TPA: aminodeoxychorismate lyase [Burkholderiales bacterium]|nr:aminodeoxychorismate lyase [Burkholderiales bacterium]
MILVNGAPAESVAATDRGLAYGDGVFRTLLVREGRPLCWARHYRRLAHDCAALALPAPEERLLREELARAAPRAGEWVAKIIVTRGSGPRGYAPPPSPEPTRIVSVSPAPRYPADLAREGVRLHLCETRLALQPRLAGIKHLNRLENVLARAEWSDPGVPEGLMLDAEGNAIGGTMTSLFIVENGSLVAPRLDRCGIAGVTRERVMEAAQARAVACREERVPFARLLAAEEVLLVNSVVGAWRVRECAGRKWAKAAVAACVREWLDETED